MTALVVVGQVKGLRQPPDVRQGRGGRSQKPVYVADWKSLITLGERVDGHDAPVVVVEFGDLQRPVCRAFMQSYDSVKKKYGDSLGLVFVHFPLLTLHPQARSAAQASECAASQGRFAAFCKTVYLRQDSLGHKPWRSYARDAGVRDLGAFDKCVADTTLMPRVRLGQERGEKLGVNGTPTLLINGWRYDGSLRPGRLDSAVQSILHGKAPPGAAK